MGSRHRSWWLLYSLGSLFILGALGWVSAVMLELEAAEEQARQEQSHQQSIRLALWRMDSWLGPQLAAEVARLPGEYRAYTPQAEAYTKVFNQIEPGEVLVPSPLLTFESEIIRLHFELDPNGDWSSPQVPVSNDLDLAEANGCIEPLSLGVRQCDLAELQSLVDYGGLAQRLEGAEENFGQLFLSEVEPQVTGAELEHLFENPEFENELNVRERNWRAQLTQQAQIPAAAEDSTVYWLNNKPLPEASPQLPKDAHRATRSSPLVPLWIDGGGEEPKLCFARRVEMVGGPVIQGFLADWTHLRSGLVTLIVDLLPEATIEPLSSGDPRDDLEGRLLATLPATLNPGVIPVAVKPAWSATKTSLLLGWLVALGALGVVAFSLRLSIDYGDQRSRFASAVTHELRTPLTTFRLYSDMLATGMVPADRQQEYLDTLNGEADRLSNLVENVLCYARLEQGRAGLRRERVRVGEIMERALPGIRRRSEESDMTFVDRTQESSSLELRTDADAVAQVLFNLVDNACKYGRGVERAEIQLCVQREAGGVCFLVRDFGEGIPGAQGRNIFRAFDRGSLEPADPNSGIGLGLAISQGLARDLGGDLVLLSPTDGPGAAFLLRLPEASSVV